MVDDRVREVAEAEPGGADRVLHAEDVVGYARAFPLAAVPGRRRVVRRAEPEQLDALDGQLKTLRLQASKAQKYQEYSGRLRELPTELREGIRTDG